MPTMTPTPTRVLTPAPARAQAPSQAPAVDEIRGGLRLVQLHDDLARVTLPSGEVLGYVERFDDPRGERFRAKRFLPRQRRFVEIGEFWSRADATDCFRFA
ncbi:hypothetical protein [Frondihabitans peucedani]